MGVGDIVLEFCCIDVSVMQSVLPVRQREREMGGDGDGGETL